MQSVSDLPQSTEPCMDKSKYCGLVLSFDLCGKAKYEKQCCQTCGGGGGKDE